MSNAHGPYGPQYITIIKVLSYSFFSNVSDSLAFKLQRAAYSATGALTGDLSCADPFSISIKA